MQSDASALVLRKSLTQNVSSRKNRAEHVLQWRELEGSGPLTAETCDKFLQETGPDSNAVFVVPCFCATQTSIEQDAWWKPGTCSLPVCQGSSKPADFDLANFGEAGELAGVSGQLKARGL